MKRIHFYSPFRKHEETFFLQLHIYIHIKGLIYKPVKMKAIDYFRAWKVKMLQFCKVDIKIKLFFPPKKKQVEKYIWNYAKKKTNTNTCKQSLLNVNNSCCCDKRHQHKHHLSLPICHLNPYVTLNSWSEKQMKNKRKSNKV